MQSISFRVSCLVLSRLKLVSPIPAILMGTLLCAQNMTVPGSTQPAGTDKVRILDEYGKLPLSFEPAPGNNSGEYLARASGASLVLSGNRMSLALQPVSTPRTSTTELTLQVALEGASDKALAQAINELPGKTNIFTGGDPKHWRTDIPNYSKVEYSNIYPGVDLVYYGDRSGRLEHDFIVSPGAQSSCYSNPPRRRRFSAVASQRQPSDALEK